MYPSQPVSPEGPRHPGHPMPGRPGQSRTAGRNKPAPNQVPGVPGKPVIAPDPGAHSALNSFVTYAKALESLDRTIYPEVYAEHLDRIKELRPLLKAHGILDVMTIKNPEVAGLVGA